MHHSVFNMITFIMLNISEESGGEEGIQINKTVSLSRGRLSIQSAPAASEDYHSQTSQSSAHINCPSKRWADNTR